MKAKITKSDWIAAGISAKWFKSAQTEQTAPPVTVTENEIKCRHIKRSARDLAWTASKILEAAEYALGWDDPKLPDNLRLNTNPEAWAKSKKYMQEHFVTLATEFDKLKQLIGTIDK